MVEAPESATVIAWWHVLIYSTIMAAVSGLGALPLAFLGGSKSGDGESASPSLSPFWASVSNACVCGVMLAVSFDLIHEGQPYGLGMVLVGLIIGIVFIKQSQEYLKQFDDISMLTSFTGTSKRKSLLVLAVMTLHAFGEGSGVGVSYSGQEGWKQGLLVTLAIGLHNIPEGLALSMVMTQQGSSVRAAALWTILSSLPQPLLAVPSFVFVDTFQKLLPLGLGFAAGSMIWVVFAEIVPESLESANSSIVATCATVSASGIEGFRMSLEYIADHDSSDLSSIVNVRKIAAFFLPMIIVTAAYLSRYLKSFFYLWKPNTAGWWLSILSGSVLVRGIIPISRALKNQALNWVGFIVCIVSGMTMAIIISVVGHSTLHGHSPRKDDSDLEFGGKNHTKGSSKSSTNGRELDGDDKTWKGLPDEGLAVRQYLWLLALMSYLLFSLCEITDSFHEPSPAFSKTFSSTFALVIQAIVKAANAISISVLCGGNFMWSMGVVSSLAMLSPSAHLLNSAFPGLQGLSQSSAYNLFTSGFALNTALFLLCPQTITLSKVGSALGIPASAAISLLVQALTNG